MRTSAVLSALLACVVAGSAGSGSALAKKPSSKKVAEVDASRCARYSERQTVGGDGMQLSVENRCATAIRCSVRYATSCGKGGAATPHDESFDVDGGGAHELEATVSCGDEAWKISSPTWRCRMKPGDLETARRPE